MSAFGGKADMPFVWGPSVGCCTTIPNANPVMAGTSAVENMVYVKARTPRLEGIMFNWKTRECAQEIFAFTLAIGVLLTLASAIPA
jgi:hypothetical protein